MDINITETNEQVNISVKGDIEMMTIKSFQQKLFEIGEKVNKNVEIDLSDVDYIDSSGIGILIGLLKLQKQKGKSLLLINASPKIINILKLSSLANYFKL